MQITTTPGGFRVREHRGFGHGLRPGTTSDMNCPICIREDADDARTARRMARLPERLAAVQAANEASGSAR